MWTASPRLPSQLAFGWVQPVGGPQRKLESGRKTKLEFSFPFFLPICDLIPPQSQFLLSGPSGMLKPVRTYLQYLIYTSLPSFVLGDITLVPQK